MKYVTKIDFGKGLVPLLRMAGLLFYFAVISLMRSIVKIIVVLKITPHSSSQNGLSGGQSEGQSEGQSGMTRHQSLHELNIVVLKSSG